MMIFMLLAQMKHSFLNAEALDKVVGGTADHVRENHIL